MSDGRLRQSTLGSAVELAGTGLAVRTAHLSAFRRIVTRISRSAAVRLFEVVPTDESLESVFDYLVHR